MKEEKYYEMVKFVSYVIQSAHKIIMKSLSLQNEDPNEFIERHNPFITSLVLAEIMRVYGQKDAYEFFNKFGGENSESLCKHIETMIDNGDLVVKVK